MPFRMSPALSPPRYCSTMKPSTSGVSLLFHAGCGIFRDLRREAEFEPALDDLPQRQVPLVRVELVVERAADGQAVLGLDLDDLLLTRLKRFDDFIYEDPVAVEAVCAGDR